MPKGTISVVLRRIRTVSFYVLTFLIITAGAIWLALRITPLQTVSAAGQTAQVGATLPNASVQGPGELDLFGQVMATKPQFTGPIRPRLALDHITIDPQVVQMLRSDGPQKVELTLSQQLASGWERYFLWETLIAAGFAAVPLIAVAAVRKRPKIWRMLAGGLAVVCAVNVGGILLTASGTPKVLRSVKTLDDLVGADPMAEPGPIGGAQPGVEAALTGVTVGFDARGRLLAWMGQSSHGVVTIRLGLPATSSRTVYDRLGDYVPWAAVGIVLLAALVMFANSRGFPGRSAGVKGEHEAQYVAGQSVPQ